MVTRFSNKLTLKNILLFSTVLSSLLYIKEANAELGLTRAPTIDAVTNSNYYPTWRVAETNNENTFSALQTFDDLTFSADGSATVNTVSTSVSSSSTDSELVTAKAVYDALQNSSGVTSSELATTLADYAKTTDLDSYAKTTDLDNYAKVTDLDDYAKSSDVYSKTDADSTFATQDAISDMLTKTEASSTYATTTDLAAKANSSDVYSKTDIDTKLNSYATTDSLTTTLGDYAKTDDLDDYAKSSDVYSKTEADSTFATQDAISDMLTKTEASSTYATTTDLAAKANSSDVYTKTDIDTKLNSYATGSELTSTNNAVSAAVNRIAQNESDILSINNSDVMNSGITADKVSTYEGYATQIASKQEALSTEQMAVLNSGITADDVNNVKNASQQINAMSKVVENFGDTADFTASTTGNISNGGNTNATTATSAIANIDATMGQIHGLANKVGVENGGKNLGQNTTVEEHLTSLAGAIGDRTNYSEQNYIENNQSVAQSLDNLDVAVGKVKKDFTIAQSNNEYRLNELDTRIGKLDTKFSKGIAASNALAALKPLDSCSRSQLSIGFGGFDGNQAVAIGAFHYINDSTLLNAGYAYSGSKYNSYNVGISFGF